MSQKSEDQLYTKLIMQKYETKSNIMVFLKTSVKFQFSYWLLIFAKDIHPHFVSWMIGLIGNNFEPTELQGFHLTAAIW